MGGIEDDIKKQLSNYSLRDVHIAKSEWRDKIAIRDFEYFENLKGANIQVVYDILNPKKIKKIEKAADERVAIYLKHSKKYEIKVIIVLEKNRLIVITYFKQPIRHKKL